MNSEETVYSALVFPEAPGDRPYTYINMVTTIDGKILSGSRDEAVLDLGSQVDHTLMKRIELSADAIMMGAQTLRASPKNWVPRAATRIVVSRSGDLPYDAGFFQVPGAFVATGTGSMLIPPPGVGLLQEGHEDLDFSLLLHRLRNKLGIRRLLVVGGSELNAQLLAAGLVDELFVTIAPKVKLGRDVPTYADGEALSREHLQRYSLIEHHAIGDEIFIRYRRDSSAGS